MAEALRMAVVLQAGRRAVRWRWQSTGTDDEPEGEGVVTGCGVYVNLTCEVGRRAAETVRHRHFSSFFILFFNFANFWKWASLCGQGLRGGVPWLGWGGASLAASALQDLNLAVDSDFTLVREDHAVGDSELLALYKVGRLAAHAGSNPAAVSLFIF